MPKSLAKKQIAFENYERNENIKGSSEKSFGIVFAVFFAVVALIKQGLNFPQELTSFTPTVPWFMASLAMLATAYLCPHLLKPFNQLWLKFGLLLHRIVNPIVMGLLFFCILTPMAMVARLFKWDPLRLHVIPHATTYWIVREPSQNSHLKNQF